MSEKIEEILNGIKDRLDIIIQLIGEQGVALKPLTEAEVIATIGKTTIEESKNYIDVDRIEDYPGKNNDYLTYKIYLKGKHTWVPKSNLELDKCSKTRLVYKDDKIWTIDKLEWK